MDWFWKIFKYCVYGWNTESVRRVLWTYLDNVFGLIGNNPWVLAGDFNVISKSQESFPQCELSSDMNDFNDMMNFAVIFDNQYTGCFYTWSNKHEDGFLERFLINSSWLDSFHRFTV